jgi:hypothetical protein
MDISNFAQNGGGKVPLVDSIKDKTYREVLLAEAKGKRLVFSHETMGMPGMAGPFGIARKVKGIERYPHRAASVAGIGDKLIVAGEYDKSHIEWLEGIGLGPGKENVVPVVESGTQKKSIYCLVKELKNIADLFYEVRGGLLVPYYVGEEEKFLAWDLGLSFIGDPQATTLGCNKVVQKRMWEQNGVDVVPGVVFDKNVDSKQDLISKIYAGLEVAEFTSVRIRGASGASGSSQWELKNPFVKGKNGAYEAISQLAESVMEDSDQQFLVEENMQVISSPSYQGFVTSDGEVVHLGTLRQLFVDHGINTTYEGNATFGIDSKDQVESIGYTVADLLARQKYVGPFSCDFIVALQKGNKKVFPVDPNVRVPGSMYGLQNSVIMKRRHGKLVESGFRDVRVSARNSKSLRAKIGSYLYPSVSNGVTVMPLNIGPIKHGKVMLGYFGESGNAIREADAVLSRNLLT